MTLLEFLDIYLEQKSKTWKKTTKTIHTVILKKIITKNFKNSEEVFEVINNSETKKTTKINHLSVIKSFLSAYNKRMNKYVYEIEPLKIKGQTTPLKEPLSDKQMILLREEAKKSNDFEIYLMTEFLYENLPRFNEAIKILKENKFKFNELWGYYEVFEEASKNNKERQFIIPKHIQNEYEQWSKKNTFNLTYKKYSNWINEASKRVNKFLNISVNEKITSHSFRTYWITKWLNNGESTFNIMLKTGHVSDQVLINTYYRSSKEKIRENNAYLAKSSLENKAKKASKEYVIELEKTIHKLQLQIDNDKKTIKEFASKLAKFIV
ncbi:tyrosine-type recombinase/integrase [Mycoplasmopsis cynos]|uniref:Tyr recombinase domain-containing protein n=1 Tax=Mycoplasmopsis cynos TaxID=171284 RepID=A0A449AI67_9BACT|nr:tyrosine-type recombinase/integrase [Mycoplasmopsis cynos]VEU64646.1 Uncharacterised protein [Mycoplasmopsis cynos]